MAEEAEERRQEAEWSDPSARPEGAVGWYRGDDKGDQPRWVEEDEYEAIRALYPDRVDSDGIFEPQLRGAEA